MTQSHSSKSFILGALALALFAGTASAQVTVNSSTATFTYAKGGSSNSTSTTATVSPQSGDTGDAYTATIGSYVGGSPGWLTATPSGLSTLPDAALALSATATTLAAGTYSAVVTLTDTTDNTDTPATITVTLTVAPPIGTSVGATVGAPITLTYTKGTAQGTSPTAVVADGATNTYTVGTPSYGSGATGWLSAVATTNTTNNGTLTLSLTTSQLTSTAAGFYTATVVLTDSDGSTTTVYAKVTVSSPLSTSSSSFTKVLTYSQTGTASQAAATFSLPVSNSDASSDSYTIVKTSCPAWFTALAVSSGTATGSATAAAGDTVTLAINPTAANGQTAGTTSTSCVVTLQYQSVTFATVTFTSLNIVGTGLASSAASITLSYIKGGGGTNSMNTNVTSPVSGGVAFAANVATVPSWLTLTPSSGTATSSNTAVAFAVNTGVSATMAVGNYSASVHIVATGYADLVVPVTMGISNAGATLAMKEGAAAATISGIYTVGTAAPTPTVTPYSSDEPLPFTASCAVTVANSSYTATATSCLLNAAQATVGAPLAAVAYTWGYGMTISLDSALFTLPVGTIVTATVTVTPTGGAGSGTPMTLAYAYTTEMAAPTFAASTPVVPTSVAQQTVSGTSLAVLLNGTNFVGPQSIVGSSVSPTLVFLAGSTTAVPSTQITVLSSTQMSVTIPQASFPTVASGHTSTNLSIGVANQTGTATPAAATVTTNLVVTTAPVVYAITSTASYSNGGIGSTPSVAPYEFISIFGDNFGYSGLTPNFATSTVNAQDQVPGSLLISGTGTHALDLSVTFKDESGHTAVSYSAPILFANQNQINAIVPSQLVVGHTINVIVTSGASTNASDGLYTVSVVNNSPGIFTVASDGTGQGAILNVNATTGEETVNSSTNEAAIGQTVSIYMTGLGAPDSVHPDVTLATPDTTPFPTDCAAVSLTAATTSPGYMQVGNTAKGATAIAGWTAPATAWVNVDGAVVQSELLKTNIYPPCMVDPITVTFGTGNTATTATTAGGGVTWAGWAAGSIAGLYQVNVTVPSGTTTGSSVPVTVTITPVSTGYTSQAGVTLAIQ